MCARLPLLLLFFFFSKRESGSESTEKKRCKESMWVHVFTYASIKSQVTGAARLWCRMARYDLALNETVIFIYCTLLNLTESRLERERKESGKSAET